MYNYSNNTSEKKIYFSSQGAVESIKGVVINQGITYSKEDNNSNYSSSIVSDSTFINNLTYFIQIYSQNVQSRIDIFLNGQQSKIDKFIFLGTQRFYIVESI
jgi:hypothetical protein